MNGEWFLRSVMLSVAKHLRLTNPRILRFAQNDKSIVIAEENYRTYKSATQRKMNRITEAGYIIFLQNNSFYIFSSPASLLLETRKFIDKKTKKNSLKNP